MSKTSSQLISLRKLKLADKSYFEKWWRDQELVTLTSGVVGYLSDAELARYFKKMYQDKKDFNFIIQLNGLPIGHIALQSRSRGWFETQIVIGNKNARGKGYGPQAIKKIIAKAKRLGQFKIYLEVRPDNGHAIQAYEKCGFVPKRIIKYPKNKHLPCTLKMVLAV